MAHITTEAAIAGLPSKSLDRLLNFLTCSDRGVKGADDLLERLGDSLAMKSVIGKRTVC